MIHHAETLRANLLEQLRDFCANMNAHTKYVKTGMSKFCVVELYKAEDSGPHAALG